MRHSYEVANFLLPLTSMISFQVAQIIPGWFANGNAELPTDPPPIQPRFGLVDASPAGWENLKTTISYLKGSAPEGTSYRVLFIGRHGEGFHNVAERLYGSEAWNKTFSKLNGDGNITWGPDAKLTDLGVQQANVAHGAWTTELPRGIPLPESVYSSPLTRAVHTAFITFDAILINPPDCPLVHSRPLIKEKLREMNGVHTCDKRSPRSQIVKEFPQFDFEPEFSEDDQLWSPEHRETEDELTMRLREALDEIFSLDPATYISITAHSGAFRAMLNVMGVVPFELRTGGVVALFVKVVQNKEPEEK